MENVNIELDLAPGTYLEALEPEEIDEFQHSQKGYSLGFARFQPYNVVMPKTYGKFDREIRSFPIRDDDVWIASFPKCGTTWTQEMVWCIRNNVDLLTAKRVSLDHRVPFLELTAIMSHEDKAPRFNTIEIVDKMESPRMIKTHLNLDMLPQDIMLKKNKIIYVTRNPRDACVSFFNHWKIFEGYHGSFETFVDAFLSDVCGYNCPFFLNVFSYWNRRNEGNILFLFYEEMKRDLPGVIRKIGLFLGKPVPEEKMQELVDHLSFEKMKNNSSVNKMEVVQVRCQKDSNRSKMFKHEPLQKCLDDYNVIKEKVTFMRKGQVGNWKEHLTPEMVTRFEKWEAKWLQGSDLQFIYE